MNAPAHTLVATSLARVDLDIEDQWTVLWALRDRYREDIKQRDRCRQGVSEVIAPEKFEQWATDAEENMARIEAVVAKLPKMLQGAFRGTVAAEAVMIQ